jgi:nucleoside phosphorylase
VYPLIRPDDLAREESRRVYGATVNSCTGTTDTGLRRKNQFGAAFETMEGAAVAHIGQICGVEVCEIRAISNVAARRDMRSENIRLALRNLREYLEDCARKE